MKTTTFTVLATLLAATMLAASARAESRVPYPPPPPPLDPAVTQATLGATICKPGWNEEVKAGMDAAIRVLHAEKGRPTDPTNTEIVGKLPPTLGATRGGENNADKYNRRAAAFTRLLHACLRRSVCTGKAQLAEVQALLWTHTLNTFKAAEICDRR